MNFIWHFIVNVVVSFVFTGGAFLAVNIVLIISGRGNPRGIRDGPRYPQDLAPYACQDSG